MANYILKNKKRSCPVCWCEENIYGSTSERVWVSLERMVYSIYHRLQRNRDYWRRFQVSCTVTKVMRTLTIALVGQLSLFKFIAVNLFGTPKQIDCNKESYPSFSTSLFLICAHCIGCYCCETLCHSNTVFKLDSDARTHSLAHTGTWYWMLRITWRAIECFSTTVGTVFIHFRLGAWTCENDWDSGLVQAWDWAVPMTDSIESENVCWLT